MSRQAVDQLEASIVRTCVLCGCDDDHACPDGCAWHYESATPALGICTNCAWELGDRDPEAVITETLLEWDADAPTLALDRADAGDLILPGDEDFHL